MTYPTVVTSRRAERLRQKRQQRRRLIIAAVAVLVVAAVVAAVVLVTHRGTDKKGLSVAGRSQRTVLLQVTGSNGNAAMSALLAHDPSGNAGAVVLLPPQVFVTTASGGSTTLGAALRTVGGAGERDAISDLMGVTVDGGWVLDQPTFEKLVNLEGGVMVDVDVTVTSGRNVLLQPGTQRLNGRQSFAFATFLASGEQEQSRLSRLQLTLDAVVSALPTDPVSLLSSLGKGSASSVPAKALGAVLSGLQKDDTTSNLQYRDLPVVPIDDGSGTTAFRLDMSGTQTLVEGLLAQSIPEGIRSGAKRVLVLNGVGRSIGTAARTDLVKGGFVFVGARNADMFGYKQSQVLVPDSTQASADLGAKVAKALGLPASDVRSSDQLGTLADVAVVIGEDFKG